VSPVHQLEDQSGPGYIGLGAKLAELAATRAGQPSSSNSFILPTYSGLTATSGLGEIYTDVRLESDKKNLLTLPTDPNKMYIKPARSAPAAEVIVYPMGQLLGQTHHQMVGGQDPMAMAGSSEMGIAQVMQHQQQLTSGGKTGKMAAGEGEEPPPHGLLQTLVRSAKDDLKIVGNVFKHLTGVS
jgi:hypothetical protein